MRIKRLDITGFKSFMERTVFAFEDGVTGIVGPNGCGKSNVVDAIRWAMGEQSAKNLRGRGMEDVIFNGSENHSPLSMAEVSLTFRLDETDQLSPQYAGFSEVTVTRRLFRSGESEYLINRSPCRLLDVSELFLGTGVGTKAYSIVEQGRVGLIVSSKPEDRRLLIEEAAGVTKYKARRKAAERKMDSTRQNLVRVADIVSELKQRLDSLERQAKKAEKYKRLRTEMRDLELHQAAVRHLALKQTEQGSLDEHTILVAQEQEALAQVRALESDIQEKRRILEEEANKLQAVSDQVHALERRVELDAQNLAHAKEDQEAARQKRDASVAEQEDLKARLDSLMAERVQREEELSSLSGTWREDEDLAQKAQVALREVSTLQSDLSLKLEMERASLVAIASRVANHQSNLASLMRQKSDLETRIAKNRSDAEVLRAREAELDKARSEVSQRVAQTRQLALEISERKGAEEELYARTRQEFAESEVQVIGLRESLADKRSRLASLEEIQRSYEGFDRGVRSVMAKAGAEPRSAGVFGLVAELLTVVPRFEKAIEAALGERLSAVVVERLGVGVDFISHLKAAAEGRSTFLPVENLSAAEDMGPPELGEPGVLGWALAEVQVEDALKPLLRTLLRDVVLVDDMGAAVACAQKFPQWTYVTLDGDLFRRDGSVTGGSPESAGGTAAGALTKKREIADLSKDVSETESRYNLLLTRHYALQKQLSHVETVLKGLEKNRHAEELNAATQEKDLHRAGEELARARERLAELDSECAALSRQLADLSGEEEASRGEVAHGETDREAREEKVRKMTSELEDLRHRQEALTSDVTSLRIKVAAQSERGESARKALDQIVQQAEDVRGRLERTDAVAQESSARVDELAKRIFELEHSEGDFSGELLNLRGQFEGERDAYQAEMASVKDLELALKDRRTESEGKTAELSALALRLQQVALERGQLEAQIQERHQVALAEVSASYAEAAPLPAESEQRLEELRSQVGKLGDVNLTALDEHTELSTRYDFLQKQKDDLESSLARLADAIEQIDRTTRERFKESFDVINDKFQKVFPRLFKGGRAQLVLTDEGSGQEAGVEIVAQPPGKKLQSMNLLSGGEKALTATALIFAIFLIKPTPFCLLDEVDAPLDEGNVGRYNEMVKEMSQGSQFILITHNKRTMEVADTLYGVTMEEPGVSKLVSVKLSDSEAMNQDIQVSS